MRKLLLLLCLMLAACSTTSGESSPPEPEVIVKTKIVDTACDWTRAIYVDKADVLTDSTAEAILAHNRAGAKVCGWRPKGK